MLKKFPPNTLIEITFILLILTIVYLSYQLEKRNDEIIKLMWENIELNKELNAIPKDSLKIQNNL